MFKCSQITHETKDVIQGKHPNQICNRDWAFFLTSDIPPQLCVSTIDGTVFVTKSL